MPGEACDANDPDGIPGPLALLLLLHRPTES